MSELRALAYADWRAFINDWRRIVRSPGRIAAWLLYGMVLGFFLFRRVLPSHSAPPSASADRIVADYFAGGLLTLLAFALASGAGSIAIFRSQVEARFIIGSPIAAPLAIAYLQVRASIGQARRLVFSFVYFLFAFGPRTGGVVGSIADGVLMLGIGCAAAAIVVPRRLLSRPAGLLCAVIGSCLAVVAMAPAMRDSVATLPLPLPPIVVATLLRWIPATLHPGAVLLTPTPVALLVVLAIVAAAIGVLAAAGRDAYPELYAISLATIDRVERWRLRRDAGLTRNAKRFRLRSTLLSLPAPAGVLVFVWKSVVEFTRRATPLAIGRGALLWCVAGFAVARAIAPDPDMLFVALSVGSSYLILVVGVAATSALAGEIRRPLFWLASTPLFERLCSLALARMWRSMLTLELVALGFALGGGTLIDTLVLAIELPAVVALLTSVGFVAFALLPSSADARGPVTLLRFGLSLVLVIPPLVLGGVAAMVAGSLPALAGAAFLALCEAGALIGIAAWRLDGHTERLAG